MLFHNIYTFVRLKTNICTWKVYSVSRYLNIKCLIFECWATPSSVNSSNLLLPFLLSSFLLSLSHFLPHIPSILSCRFFLLTTLLPLFLLLLSFTASSFLQFAYSFPISSYEMGVYVVTCQNK